MKCTRHPNEEALPGKKNCQRCVDISKSRRERSLKNGTCLGHPERKSSSTSKNKCQECLEMGKFAAIKRKFGISKEEYFSMLKSRNNKCDLCKEEMQEPFIDHCHKTGVARGFLCLRCNAILGFFGEDMNRIKLFLAGFSNHLAGNNFKQQPE